MNNSPANTIAFILIIARSMKLPTSKLCVVCLGGVIVVNYGNKHLFPNLCPPMAKFARENYRLAQNLVSTRFFPCHFIEKNRHFVHKPSSFLCHFIGRICTLCINLHPFFVILLEGYALCA